MAYCLAVFLIFGALHTVTGRDTDRFLLTGAIGFAFAVIYINSRNIVVPMILHTVYDMIANLDGFIIWNDSALFGKINSWFETAVVIMFILSFIMLFRKDSHSR